MTVGIHYIFNHSVLLVRIFENFTDLLWKVYIFFINSTDYVLWTRTNCVIDGLRSSRHDEDLIKAWVRIPIRLGVFRTRQHVPILLERKQFLGTSLHGIAQTTWRSNRPSLPRVVTIIASTCHSNDLGPMQSVLRTQVPIIPIIVALAPIQFPLLKRWGVRAVGHWAILISIVFKVTATVEIWERIIIHLPNIQVCRLRAN